MAPPEDVILRKKQKGGLQWEIIVSKVGYIGKNLNRAESKVKTIPRDKWTKPPSMLGISVPLPVETTTQLSKTIYCIDNYIVRSAWWHVVNIYAQKVTEEFIKVG